MSGWVRSSGGFEGWCRPAASVGRPCTIDTALAATAADPGHPGLALAATAASCGCSEIPRDRRPWTLPPTVVGPYGKMFQQPSVSDAALRGTALSGRALAGPRPTWASARRASLDYGGGRGGHDDPLRCGAPEREPRPTSHIVPGHALSSAEEAGDRPDPAPAWSKPASTTEATSRPLCRPAGAPPSRSAPGPPARLHGRGADHTFGTSVPRSGPWP